MQERPKRAKNESWRGEIQVSYQATLCNNQVGDGIHGTFQDFDGNLLQASSHLNN